MNQKEKIEHLARQERLYREALGYVVRGAIAFSDPRMVSAIAGMPPRMIRIGLIESSDPLIVVHEIDSLMVNIRTPDQVADWHSDAIAVFPGLTAFLVKYADTTSPVNIHTPSWSWRRTVAEH